MTDVNKGFSREKLEEILSDFNGLYIRYYSHFTAPERKAHSRLNRMIREFIDLERDKEIDLLIKQEDMFTQETKNLKEKTKK